MRMVPIFIRKISKGRTFTSFIILGNYGVAQQLKHGVHISGFIV